MSNGDDTDVTATAPPADLDAKLAAFRKEPQDANRYMNLRSALRKRDAKEQLAENSVLIELDREVMRSGSTPVVIGVYSNGRKIQTLKTSFIGPRDDTVQ